MCQLSGGAALCRRRQSAVEAGGSATPRHAAHVTPRTPRHATRRAAPRTRQRQASTLPLSVLFLFTRASRGRRVSTLEKIRPLTVSWITSRGTCVPGNTRNNEERERERERERLSLESRLTEVDRNFTDEGTTSQPPLPQRRFCLEKVRPHAVSSRLRVTISNRDCDYKVGARMTIRCF